MAKMTKMTKTAKVATDLVDKTAETATHLVDKTAETATDLVDKTANKTVNKTVKTIDNVIVRLVIYYVAICLLFGSIIHLTHDLDIETRVTNIDNPMIGTAVIGFLSPQGKGEESRHLEETRVSKTAPKADPEDLKLLVPVSKALLFSFLLTLPVTWVYSWTRSRKKYNRDFVYTLLVLPIAIALVVFLIKDSTALAFGLAGIVAAVQFRTSLTNPLDATYMFIVIGIGLATGVQAGHLAILASVAFNAIVLSIWRMNYGATPIVLSGFRIVHSAKASSLLSASAAQAKSPKYNAKLRVHTTQSKAAQQAVVALLETYAKRWRQVRTVPKKDGTDSIEFDVRLKKTMDPAAFTRKLQKNAESYINKVELEL